MLFSNICRTDSAPRQGSESSYVFMNRSARPEIARARNFLTEAFLHYPDSERNQIASRIQLGSEDDFRSATFEIYLHELLIRLGYQLTPHPDPGTGVSKRPDFLVKDTDGNDFYLEAVLATESDGRDPTAEAIINSTIDYLNTSPHTNFFVLLESEGDPTTYPRKSVLLHSIHEWLNQLDPVSLRAQLITHGVDSMPQMKWEHEEWKLMLIAFPLSDDQRGKANQLIGGHFPEATIVNIWEPLRKAVKRKANRYGDLVKPFVVVVNADIFHLDQIDEEQALYGEEYWREVIGHPDKSGPARHSNGAWRGPHGPQNRRVSAVWFFNDLNPYSLANRRSTLYINPWANFQTPDGLLRIPTRRLHKDRLVDQPGIDLKTIFDLPADWPDS